MKKKLVDCEKERKKKERKKKRKKEKQFNPRNKTEKNENRHDHLIPVPGTIKLFTAVNQYVL
jgi:hypothetical protein